MAKLLALLLAAFFVLAAQPREAGRWSLSGTVTDAATRQPIPGTRVRAQAGSREALHTMTDGRGRYEFSGSGFDTYRLRSYRVGFVEAAEGGVSVSFSAERTRVEVDLTLERQAVISGKVTDASGTSIAAAKVTLLREPRPLPGSQRASGGAAALQQAASVSTNDLGEYRLSQLRPGAYFLLAYPGGDIAQDKAYKKTYYPGTPDVSAAQQILLAAGQELRAMHLAIVEQRGVRVSGTLLNLPREMLEDARRARADLYLRPKRGSDGNRTVAVGQRFEFADVPAGDYTIEAETTEVRSGSGGFTMQRVLWARQPVTVRAVDLDAVQVALQPTIALTGMVDSETNCPKMPVTFYLLPADGSLFSPVSRLTAMVKEDGSFVVNGLVPATYRIDRGIRPGLPYVVGASLGGQDVLGAGFALTGADAGPLRVKVSCAPAGGTQ